MKKMEEPILINKIIKKVKDIIMFNYLWRGHEIILM